MYWNVLNIINKDIKKTYSLKGFRQVKRNNFIEINSFKDLKKRNKKILKILLLKSYWLQINFFLNIRSIFFTSWRKKNLCSSRLRS